MTSDTDRAGAIGVEPCVEARRPGAGEVATTSLTVPNSPHLTHFPVHRSERAPQAEHSKDGLDLATVVSLGDRVGRMRGKGRVGWISTQ